MRSLKTMKSKQQIKEELKTVLRTRDAAKAVRRESAISPTERMKKNETLLLEILSTFSTLMYKAKRAETKQGYSDGFLESYMERSFSHAEMEEDLLDLYDKIFPDDE